MGSNVLDMGLIVDKYNIEFTLVLPNEEIKEIYM